ncbi:cation diffusion facilitator family transporter [Aquibium sp. A9E412]|uniref:cation diffusion facilitator family transporter n=1 Tax=Aquibium sp. A9E412 TaxID=2976767 RepID=UPI0025B260D0|nr:cation diffusion facilitator family transporter [Aquibium sp. A9E412]MDN2564637.1 cation diffusion facilitator family transporter [Aquibium sp. A9E412]
MAGHHHHHHGVDAASGDRRVVLAIVVNLGLTLAQIVGGLVAGSLALIADAIHNFSDAASLMIAFGARRIARRPSDRSMTFGYGRVEVVAALINYTTLIVIGLYLLYEAALRFVDPQGVDGWLVIIIAGIALVVDAATALLTYALSKQSVNIRAAFLHNVADALGSVAVIVAGTLILLYDWRLVDPLVTVMIAGYILWQSFREIGPVIRILMLGSPPDIAADKVVAAIRGVAGVHAVHHAHLWQMDEHENALDAHLVIEEGAWRDADDVKARTKALLAREFGIGHSTLEMECARHACPDAQTFGHPSGEAAAR